MASAFNMDELLDALNVSLQGTVVTELPNSETLSFFDNENEYELGSGQHKGQLVIKVRYRGNLTPLYQGPEGYYISVYSGSGSDGKPSFKTLMGDISPTTPTFVKWQPKRKQSKPKATDVAMAPARASRKIAKPSRAAEQDVSMMTEEELVNVDSPATRRELARRKRESRKEIAGQADELSDLFANLKTDNMVEFGKRRRRKSSKKSIHTVNADIRYLSSL